MFLKALEIQGFKSFPDRTRITVGKGITAVVGPNGSGKSNISDAIRWVLGETSAKQLRGGGKMENVIFGGTQQRGAMGFASVSLVVDNTDRRIDVDNDEVTIGRKYYRSGDSEYSVNGQNVRLKDIYELFLDTGLGRDGYSVIGQGRIDEILALKSTDRREIFEEAAGISKFRHRKEDTERRLANTEDNLLRIGDKISELELQVGPLREQAEKAQKYLTFRTELKGLEVTVWLENLKKIAENARKAETDYASAAFILEQAHDELTALYSKAEQLSLQYNHQTLQLDQQREHISQMEAERQQEQPQPCRLPGPVLFRRRAASPPARRPAARRLRFASVRHVGPFRASIADTCRSRHSCRSCRPGVRASGRQSRPPADTSGLSHTSPSSVLHTSLRCSRHL